MASWPQSLRRWATGAPLDLAVFRVTVMVVTMLAVEVRDAEQYAALEGALRTPPWGFGWATAFIPANSSEALILKYALVGTASLALVGFLTRWALVGTTVLLLLLLALPQQWGAGVHTHHLLWFSALLAGAPSGDALSVDAWLRRRRGIVPPRASLAHGVPVRAAWVSIGLIFFFPGLWKLHQQGLGWALSDNLVHQLYFKWLELGQLPSVRLDQYPLLLKAGGLGVLLLELTALPLLLWDRTRLITVGALLAFHAATQAFFFIAFSSLWVCYLVFFPWSRWLDECDPHDPPKPMTFGTWVALAMAAFIVCGQLLSGALRIEHGWPFACYPTFRFDPGKRAPVLIVEETLRDGTKRELSGDFLKGPSGQREWSAMWHLLRQPERERLAAWWRARQRDTAHVVSVSFFRGSIAVNPEEWSSPPLPHELLVSVEP